MSPGGKRDDRSLLVKEHLQSLNKDDRQRKEGRRKSSRGTSGQTTSSEYFILQSTFFPSSSEREIVCNGARRARQEGVDETEKLAISGIGKTSILSYHFDYYHDPVTNINILGRARF